MTTQIANVRAQVLIDYRCESNSKGLQDSINTIGFVSIDDIFKNIIFLCETLFWKKKQLKRS